MNENMNKRGKYRFGLMEVGQVVWSTSDMNKRSARSLISQLHLSTAKRFRIFSNRQGFCVIRDT